MGEFGWLCLSTTAKTVLSPEYACCSSLHVACHQSRLTVNHSYQNFTTYGVFNPSTFTVFDECSAFSTSLSLTARTFIRSYKVDSVVRSCFYQLRQRRSIRWSMTLDAAHTLVHAFLHSRVDYCNAILIGAMHRWYHPGVACCCSLVWWLVSVGTSVSRV
jgi:hypothetical protein